MFGLVEGIARHIEDWAIARRSVIAQAVKGSSQISIETFKNYSRGDAILIYDENQNVAEINSIKGFTSIATLDLCHPLSFGYGPGAKVEKAHNARRLTTVHRGHPPTITDYPAVTVKLLDRSREPLTLEDVADDYALSIRVYVEAGQDFQADYERFCNLTHRVENALFIPLQPLIPPLFETTLAADAGYQDSTITVTDPEKLPGGTIVIDNESAEKTKLIKKISGNEIELTEALGSNFSVGDRIRKPLVHSYDPDVGNTRYDSIENDRTIIHVAQIIYSLKLQKTRYKSNRTL